jgi:hypothetical protein
MVSCCLLMASAGTPAGSASQLIPVERTCGEAWQHAGHPGEIPAPARIVNVRDFGALGDGAGNDWPAVAAAIASLSNAPGVVYFPAGLYLLQSTVHVPGGVVLRGERSHNTTLRFDHLGHCISIARGQGGAFQPVLSGHTIHSDTIVVTDGSVFASGDYAEIREDNDPAWGASDWASKVVGQLLRVTAVAGNTLTLERPLRITYQAAQNPEIRKIIPVTGAGIENLRIDRLLAGTAAQRDNIFTVHLEYAARCWVRGVESTNTFGGHVALVYSTQVDVTGCYLHHAWDYDGGGSGYGVRLEFKTGECRIENNIFNHLRHAMLLQAGVNGNVFGYNYSREPTRSEFPSEVSGDVVCHGNYPFANLFEGNICQHITVDASHGANGPLNTFFRNRAETYGLNVTDSLVHSLNVVGNETFTGTYALFVGDGYALRGTNRFEYGNNTQSDGIQEPGTTNLTDYSYYLNDDPSAPPSLPAFWNIADAFPTIGLPLALNAPKNIPARTRYFAGASFTVGPPSLARQPTNQTVNAGQAAAFSVEATGTPVARYQWSWNGVALAGRTNATLTILHAQPSDTGSYEALVWDDFGAVRSAPASLMVTGSVLYPPGDVNGDGRVTGSDSLLINQVLVGLRGSNDPVFTAATFANGDANRSASVTGGDSLLINQVMVCLRSYVVTKIAPDSRSNDEPTPVTILGIGFSTNAPASVTIGPPVNLPLANVIVASREQINAVVPPGGGAGSGAVHVMSSPSNGVISFAEFLNGQP